MAKQLEAAPVLSTPDDHIFEEPVAESQQSTLSNDTLRSTYEIERTVAEIVAGKWRRVALQFPDHMLVDAPRVSELLSLELNSTGQTEKTRFYILADTSYSACCVDEIAAEHVDADVVIHYGRTCLSPTSRLPVIYVYTSHRLDHDAVVQHFCREFVDVSTRIVLMADIVYQNHVEPLSKKLRSLGYSNVISTEIIRDPNALIPNRKLSDESLTKPVLQGYAIFHVSEPPTSLLLALQTRFQSLHVLSVSSSDTPSVDNLTFRTAGLLRRRFARVLSLASAGVVGILVNTLSVSNYMTSLNILRDKIARAGKKSYTVVVGKLNPAKLANFAEIEGWVVIGCWEGGLIEDEANYWRPVVTPFEMEIALMSEEHRTWGDDWWGGIEKLSLEDDVNLTGDSGHTTAPTPDSDAEVQEDGGDITDDESAPPVYDLRTGKLVSHSRPLQRTAPERARSANVQQDAENESTVSTTAQNQSNALMRRNLGEMATIKGVVSPGAEFLRSQRTWQGLGSDFDGEASTAIEEGRSGIARGYQVGAEDQTKR